MLLHLSACLSLDCLESRDEGVHRYLIKIGAFDRMRSNGAIDGTEDRETVEAEGPPTKDHTPVPQTLL